MTALPVPNREKAAAIEVVAEMLWDDAERENRAPLPFSYMIDRAATIGSNYSLILDDWREQAERYVDAVLAAGVISEAKETGDETLLAAIKEQAESGRDTTAGKWFYQSRLVVIADMLAAVALAVPETAEVEKLNRWDAEVQSERQRQVAKGYDRAHDAEHGVDHLLMWAQEYARKGEPIKSAALIEAARELLAAVPSVGTETEKKR